MTDFEQFLIETAITLAHEETKPLVAPRPGEPKLHVSSAFCGELIERLIARCDQEFGWSEARALAEEQKKKITGGA